MYGGRENMGNLCTFLSWLLCYKPKTAPKNKVLKKLLSWTTVVGFYCMTLNTILTEKSLSTVT